MYPFEPMAGEVSMSAPVAYFHFKVPLEVMA